MSAVKLKNKMSHTINVKVSEISLQVQIDLGKDVNIIDEHSFDKLKVHVALKNTRAELFAYYSNAPPPLLGFTGRLINQKFKKLKFSKPGWGRVFSNSLKMGCARNFNAKKLFKTSGWEICRVLHRCLNFRNFA